MNCRDHQQQIALLSYDELTGIERAGLEEHLRECSNCAAVLVEQRDLDQLLAENADVLDMPADLLVESRRALADELDRVETRRSRWRIPEFSVVFRPMKMLESAALVAMGLALGVYIAHQRDVISPTANPANPNDSASGFASTFPENATVIPHIVRAGPAGQIEVTGEVTQPYKLQGSIQDQKFRKLVIGALQVSTNPGARLNAVEILGQQPFDQVIKEGLILALTQDPVAGVRMKALESLKAFSSDVDVQKALVEVLRKDDDTGIRVEAIKALTQTSCKDAAVVQVLEEAAQFDNNAYVRMIGTRCGGEGK